jgi:hypothetical protein
MSDNSFFERVYVIARQTCGKASSYAIAKCLEPHDQRMVGYAMNASHDKDDIRIEL